MGPTNKFTIGRSSECHLVLGDKSVSSVHARLVYTKDGRIRLTDLGSTNGTYRLDGNQFLNISDSYVSPTDVIRFGAKEILVKEILQALQLLAPPASKSGEGGGAPSPKKVLTKKLVRCSCGNIKAPGQACSVCGMVTAGI
jgi:pSer/pThr/pTyr-binding forkhead associated (FHA) protein